MSRHSLYLDIVENDVEGMPFHLSMNRPAIKMLRHFLKVAEKNTLFEESREEIQEFLRHLDY